MRAPTSEAKGGFLESCTTEWIVAWVTREKFFAEGLLTEGARDVAAFVNLAHGEIEDESTWDEGEVACDAEEEATEEAAHK